MSKISTNKEAAAKFMESLKADGKKDSTVYRYNMDLELVVGFFGPDNEIGKVMPARVGLFLKSPALLEMKSGKPKSKATIDRTIRAMRQFFDYCVSEGIIDKSPMPKQKEQPAKTEQAA